MHVFIYLLLSKEEKAAKKYAKNGKGQKQPTMTTTMMMIQSFD